MDGNLAARFYSKFGALGWRLFRRRRWNREQLTAMVAAQGEWVHDIELPFGISTGGLKVFPDHAQFRWQFIRDYVLRHCAGESFLDVGCSDGFFCHEARKAGASYVLGIDEHGPSLVRARIAADALGRWIEYRQASVYDLPRLRFVPKQFDNILFLGVFYHLRHPLLALDILFARARKRIFLHSMIKGPTEPVAVDADYHLGEEKVFFRPGFPKLHFIRGNFAYDETSKIWWVPNANGLREIVHSYPFRNIIELRPDMYILEK